MIKTTHQFGGSKCLECGIGFPNRGKAEQHKWRKHGKGKPGVSDRK